MTVKELLINELDQMSETELEKILKLLQFFGLTHHKPSTSKNYPLRGLPVEYIDPMQPVAISDWEVIA
ncbi:MAG: hypothetical protein IM516_02275 [Pseudanabaena sp. M158S2SP1A06QC]|jgi:hypothetical protein|uniref:hypothetical protein n=1 Tax=Pseudanabaena mucicola TaxID=71190 RepID=UPI0025790C4B|nr:hypothetical protein [Pseudanabaena mucicola]MCA6574574.1 hypothetical protein [Pseudanabaena sp. M53BS1SP1A06MG]MCA6581966.1 hypothetical protein [Pseudanabaena sp. M34BS1SP1A06MG]MCA6585103.1 hypothetical protein [Pseudanabaena sp. M051S1SP1A06QC]MCA6592276.1 hypothetical protein [Pseudanabaena sp. M38BS1SP1A06MG]MCA6597229.1 hypothetical protein [Pseudanabaena sp. M046S1SP1A06QC]MCA6599493.1 hypothetical protein [Pseudanabaena sp. M57BS1SP1A06MG]MCA6610941.1 hypothetical protein [Pseud